MHELLTRPHRTLGRRARDATRVARRRLRTRMLPILQTSIGAVLAWYLAVALLPDPRPAFASIAAVIALGATFEHRGARVVELTGGVVLGLTIADVIVQVIGNGPPQMGLMTLLAMSAAALLGGGPLLIVEAAVSAVLLAAIDPAAAATGPGLSPLRFMEALIGGGVAFGVSSVFFPPNPALIVGRVVQGIFADLGRALEQVAAALAAGDAAGAREALETARGTDRRIDTLDDALAAARETARLAPRGRGARDEVARYARTFAQVDFAVRNTRVLARSALRYSRAGEPAPPELADAVRGLGAAVWELAAAYDEPRRTAEVQRLGRAAAGRAAGIAERVREPALAEIAGQVRSTAVDLVRAAELLEGAAIAPVERPTEELLREPLPA
ncbi:MAG: hypothetical protein QOJ21_753 [Solirubrobacteraceae bacterium]|jgi:uncharacterized membrane protein YgaE (UPF0421/DUF939 family)|nr:hypothetical protein [Solirubrobacteraceae bacterium]